MGECPLTVGKALLHSFFFNKKMKKNRFADWLIELANRGFGLSTDSFLMISEQFPRQGSKNYTIQKDSTARKVVSEFHHLFNSFPFY